jgi:hypothetical protein
VGWVLRPQPVEWEGRVGRSQLADKELRVGLVLPPQPERSEVADRKEVRCGVEELSDVPERPRWEVAMGTTPAGGREVVAFADIPQPPVGSGK